MTMLKRQLPKIETAAAGLISLALIVGLAGGVFLDRRVLSRVLAPPGVPDDAASEFHLMGQAWRTIRRAYVDQEAVTSRRLAYGAIDGMVRSLGDTGHSRFLSPEMARQHQNFVAGEFEGIGAYVEMRDGRVVIVAPIDRSPAQRAGLQAGDVILEVDGEDVTGLPLDEVVSRITGPAGTRVSLTIEDAQTGDARQVSLERAEIQLDLVTWERLPGTSVAHVRISSFGDGAARDLEGTLSEIREQDVDGLILDLRNNPGGLLNEAVQASSLFLEGGDVLLRKDARGEITPVAVKGEPLAPEVPMVVLVNGGTASAAEITTGALQDAGRATVVGETTVGTGTVLNRFPLSDGSLLLLAVEEWRTPDGRVIWHQGLAPDVRVTLAPDADPLLPEQERDMTEGALRDSGDAQLLKGLELLEGAGGVDLKGLGRVFGQASRFEVAGSLPWRRRFWRLRTLIVRPLERRISV